MKEKYEEESVVLMMSRMWGEGGREGDHSYDFLSFSQIGLPGAPENT